MGLLHIHGYSKPQLTVKFMDIFFRLLGITVHFLKKVHFRFFAQNACITLHEFCARLHAILHVFNTREEGKKKAKFLMPRK